MGRLLGIIILLIIFILIINLIIKKTKRSANIMAGKKWDGIVKELRERK